MSVNMNIYNYFFKKNNDKDKFVEYAKKNSLYFILSHLVDESLEQSFSYKVNVEKYLRNNLILKEIIDELYKIGILVVTFKGVVLANQLYERPQKRCVGDIDIYVENEDFDVALSCLLNTGYNYYNEKTKQNNHHIILVKNDTIVELHKRIFNPALGINEDFFGNSLLYYKTQDFQVRTFDITATFLHLLYHLNFYQIIRFAIFYLDHFHMT